MGHNAFVDPFRLGVSTKGGRLARVDVLRDCQHWAVEFRPSSGLVFLLS